MQHICNLYSLASLASPYDCYGQQLANLLYLLSIDWGESEGGELDGVRKSKRRKRRKRFESNRSGPSTNSTSGLSTYSIYRICNIRSKYSICSI